MPYNITINDIQVQSVGCNFTNGVPQTLNITGQELTSTGIPVKPFSFSLVLTPAQQAQIQAVLALAIVAYKTANGI